MAMSVDAGIRETTVDKHTLAMPMGLLDMSAMLSIGCFLELVYCKEVAVVEGLGTKRMDL